MKWQRCIPWWFAGACLVTGAPAQTLRVSSQTAVAGEWVAMEIAFQPAASALTALQWELDIPSGALDLLEGPLTRVPLAVKDAGKSVSCAVSKRTAERLLLPCILAGGQKPIPAGTIVLLSIRIGPRAQGGTVHIRLQNALGVTGDLKQAPIEAAEGELTIRGS